MADEHSIARTLDEAKKLGLARYFTGRPCKYGHVSDRYLWGGCVQCKTDLSANGPRNTSTRLKSEARKLGKLHFSTGRPCVRGHYADRLVSTGNCLECLRALSSTPKYKEAGQARSKLRWKNDRAKELSRAKEYHRRRPQVKMFYGARFRAKTLGVPFNLCADDIVIPERCPVLGIPLIPGDGKLHDGSPTLDRLKPELGYVLGNVAVISHLANRIKQNSTAQQLEAVLCWMIGRDES